jgi:hypothetical protein
MTPASVCSRSSASLFAVAGFLGLAFLLWLQHLAAVTRSRFSGNA